jgi:hypothetical protein
MPIEAPPPPPPQLEQPTPPRPDGSIRDMRGQFERKTSDPAADQARTKAFIDGKIEMIRRDPTMSDAEKAAAIAELEAKR